jgi:hypothetical protein
MIDKKDVDRITGLSKSEFDKRLSDAVTLAGLDPKVSGMLLRDSDKIKNALGSLSEKEIGELSEVLKKNKLGKIEELIKSSIDGE